MRAEAGLEVTFTGFTQILQSLDAKSRYDEIRRSKCS